MNETENARSHFMRALYRILTPSGQGQAEIGLFCKVQKIEIDDDGAIASVTNVPVNFNIIRSAVQSFTAAGDSELSDVPLFSRYRMDLVHLYDVRFVVDSKYEQFIYDPTGAFLEEPALIAVKEDMSRDRLAPTKEQPQFTETDETSSTALHCFLTFGTLPDNIDELGNEVNEFVAIVEDLQG